MGNSAQVLLTHAAMYSSGFTSFGRQVAYRRKAMRQRLGVIPPYLGQAQAGSRACSKTELYETSNRVRRVVKCFIHKRQHR